jgi:hypothetical protein
VLLYKNTGFIVVFVCFIGECCVVTGFVHGTELAKKTRQLYNMCRKMFGTNTTISDKAILGKC